MNGFLSHLTACGVMGEPLREMLYRPLYRGEVVWNRSQKIVKGATKKQRQRDTAEWIILPAPDLRIVPEALCRRVQERLDRAQALYARGEAGRLLSRPREPAAVQARIERLLDALADDSVPQDEVAKRLSTEKARKDNLTAELERLGGMLQAADVDADKIKADLRNRVHGVKDVLGRQIPQARQMLRKLLEDKIELEPVGRGRERGYKFRGALTVDRLIGGEAFVGANNTSVSGGPNGTRTLR